MIINYLIYKTLSSNYKYEFNTLWLKIFHHKSFNNKYFKNSEEALKSNTSDLYSILYKINDSFKIGNYYEFLLEYPNHNGYNRWKQIQNPLEIIEKNDELPVLGYTPINITWNGLYWGGLVKSSYGSSLLDGSTNAQNYWWYAIGSYLPYKGGIPGPANIIVQETILWIKILNLETNLKFKKKIFQIFILILIK